MTTLISPDGRLYKTSNLLEIKRLVSGFGYTVKPEDGGEVFDPADHTVAEVEKYLQAHPDDAERVLDAERSRGDDARKTLVGE